MLASRHRSLVAAAALILVLPAGAQDLPAPERIEAVRAYIKSAWATLTRSNRDLPEAARDPKLHLPAGQPFPVYVSAKEDRARLERELEARLGPPRLPPLHRPPPPRPPPRKGRGGARGAGAGAAARPRALRGDRAARPPRRCRHHPRARPALPPAALRRPRGALQRDVRLGQLLHPRRAA